jgi:hypothetical protein
MDDLKKVLIRSESEFEELKKKVERNHLLFILLYFTPPVIGLLVFSKYFKELLGVWLRIIIFSIIIFGLIIHFYLRYRYYKSKERYKDFINSVIDEIYLSSKDKNINKKVLGIVKNIYKDKNMEFNRDNIDKEDFWSLLFYQMEINDI